jgi:hypothetical protein
MSDTEYTRLQAALAAEGGRSTSEFTRSVLMKAMSPDPSTPAENICKLVQLLTQAQQLTEQLVALLKTQLHTGE